MLRRLPVLKSHIYYNPSQENNSKILRQIIIGGLGNWLQEERELASLARGGGGTFINQEENQRRKRAKKHEYKNSPIYGQCT